MTIVDEIFNEAGNNKLEETKQFNKEEWAAQKKQEKESIYQMIDQSALEFAGNADYLKKVLDVVAQFDRYSAGNILLIAKQRPDATKLANFDGWKDAGVHVKKGESGILMLGPGQEYEKSDGSVGVNYTVKKMFDISQTSAQKREPVVSADARFLLKCLLHNAPCDVTVNEDVRYPNGKNTVYDAKQNTIFVRHGSTEKRLFQELSQQITVAWLDKANYSLPDKEFVAACTSYILCKRNHLEPPDLWFEKLAQKASFENPKDIRRSLEKIREMSSGIAQNMKQFQKTNDKIRDDGAR